MNKSAAANLSLALAAGGWLLAIVTVIRNFGDQDPHIAPAVAHREHVVAAVSIWAAIILILVALLLAGLAFREARRRALATVAIALLPILVLWIVATTAGI